MTPEEYVEKLKEVQRTLDNTSNWPTAASMRQQRQK